MVRSFTLIELVAVISIMAILLSILMSIKPDKMKSDASRLNTYLMQCKTYSMTVNHTVPVDLSSQKFFNSVSAKEDTYFLKGTPVKLDESALIGCSFTVKDKTGEQEDYTIKVNTFTGKIMFEYK